MAVDLALAYRRGRLSIHLIVFTFSDPGYIFKYCQSHFGPILVPVLLIGAGSIVAAWDMLRRLIRSSPPPQLVAVVGVVCAAVVSFMIPFLPVYAGHQQGTFVGDFLAKGLRLSEVSLPKHVVRVGDVPSFLLHVVMVHIEAARRDILSSEWTPFLHEFAKKGKTHTIIAQTPMTLKSAWEALCGTAPAILANYAEHQVFEF